MYLLLLLFSSFLSARTLNVVSAPYSYQERPEFKAIMQELKPYGDFSGKPKEEERLVERNLSRGEQLVEEAKRRNREILKKRDEEDKKRAQNNAGKSELELLKEEQQRTLDAWKKEVAETHQQWKREQDIFLGRIKEYREATFELPVKKELIKEKVITLENIPDVHVINAAFIPEIRDQRARPTCSAFAGVRAVEIILAQNKEERDLSEQYFYWASKPNCRKSPCAEKGSWVTPGYRHSQSFKGVDIPLETQCAYVSTPVEKNETQVPLPPTCEQGAVKIVAYEEARTLADVVEQLKKDRPVVMAARLSENFYRNKGLVTLTDSTKKSGGMDAHSLGHAFLGVGVIELPLKLHQDEGKFCIVIANSWGKGWGAGGYSCLTEKWLLKFRQPSAFVALSELSL